MSTINLEDINPAEEFLVATSLNDGGWGFTNGHKLQRSWNSRRNPLSRISDSYPVRENENRVLCPDGTCILVKFYSEPLIDENFMSTEATPAVPTKKVPAQKSTVAPKAPAPKATKPTPPAKGSPAAKPAAKPTASPAAEKPAKGSRATFKDKTVSQVIDQLKKDGVIDELGPKAKKFFAEFIDEGKSKDYDWLPRRFKAHATKSIK